VKVARTLSFEETVVADAPVPELQAGDALVRVEACGLCGSDAHRWYVNKKAPTVLGHEPAGVVVATGGDCAVEEGQRVFFHHHVSCGVCHYCRRGYTTNCGLFKSSRLDPGGFAELVRVPRQNVERDTLVLPESVSFEQATFIEPLACTVRALDKTPLRAGDSVLVIGLGTMGFMNGLLARHRGAGLVLGSDFSAERRALAESAWGFDHTFDPSAEGFLERIRERTEGRGPDHVIVGPGSRAAVEQAIDAVAHGGSLVLFSPFALDATVELPLHKVYFGELTLVASYSCAAAETRAALELIEAGVVPVERLISHRIDLTGVGDGISKTAGAGPGWLKAIVYPHGVPPGLPQLANSARDH
jgi:L-iditol 2-dehydrogenase